MERTNVQPLPYATQLRPRRFISRGIWAFVGLCQFPIIYFGVWYIRAWHLAKRWQVPDDHFDLQFGIYCCVTGLTLFALSVHMFRLPDHQSP